MEHLVCRCRSSQILSLGKWSWQREGNFYQHRRHLQQRMWLHYSNKNELLRLTRWQMFTISIRDYCWCNTYPLLASSKVHMQLLSPNWLHYERCGKQFTSKRTKWSLCDTMLRSRHKNHKWNCSIPQILCTAGLEVTFTFELSSNRNHLHIGMYQSTCTKFQFYGP